MGTNNIAFQPMAAVTRSDDIKQNVDLGNGPRELPFWWSGQCDRGSTR